MTPQARAFAARFAVGRRARKASGRAPADVLGTRLILEGCAQPACISGLKRNASRAPVGRRTQIGMQNDPRPN